MTVENCGNCRFLHKNALCRRFPPAWVLFPIDNQPPVVYHPQQTYPYMNADDWCGEWKIADRQSEQVSEAGR